MKPRVLQSFLLMLVLLSTLFLSFGCANRKADLPETKNLVWAIGATLPEAEDFVGELDEGASVEFADANTYLNLDSGENQISLIYRPQKGRKRKLNATLTLVDDREKPVISGTRDLMAYVGDTAVEYYNGVTVSDNCDGEILLRADYSAVDLTQEGVYPVTYFATDHVGNVSMKEISLHVYKEKITLEMLYAEIDPIIVQKGWAYLSKAEQAKAIFWYVHTGAGISYVDTSDKTDWIREAYLCQQNRKGDCFSYFALSKAFFERLGIENLDVQRLPGFTDDTHYWSMINIANEGEIARWYHYDATRVRDVSASSALLTDVQVNAFSAQRAYFYYYDTSKYPASATEILIPRPDLT